MFKYYFIAFHVNVPHLVCIVFWLKSILGYIQFLFIFNKNAMNITVASFGGDMVGVFSSRYQVWNSWLIADVSVSVYKKMPKLVSKLLHHFTLPPTAYEIPASFSFLSVLNAAVLFYCNHQGSVSCGFSLNFPNHWYWWALRLICSIYIFLSEMPF